MVSVSVAIPYPLLRVQRLLPIIPFTTELRPSLFACRFVHLGEAHQKPIVEWWRKQHEAAAPCALAAEVGGLPQLTAVQKMTPAERRWRKKQQAMQGAEGQGQEGQGAEGQGPEGQRPEGTGQEECGPGVLPQQRGGRSSAGGRSVAAGGGRGQAGAVGAAGSGFRGSRGAPLGGRGGGRAGSGRFQPQGVPANLSLHPGHLRVPTVLPIQGQGPTRAAPPGIVMPMPTGAAGAGAGAAGVGVAGRPGSASVGGKASALAGGRPKQQGL